MSQYPPNLIVLYINIELESIFQPYTLIKSVQPTTSSHENDLLPEIEWLALILF